ncbi:MAG: DsbA family protein, partial [Anaerolineales bacterium]|nr:DsbA family protein [Anaerolineales bacterium]
MIKQITMQENNNLLIPGAIVVAGLIIAGAVMYSGGTGQVNNDGSQVARNDSTGDTVVTEPREVSEDDHIFGNKDADIFIIEYSDTECPFCKQFHKTLLEVIEKYGGERNSEVAWAYRHFPIPQLHAKAEAEAHATECTAELSDNDTFWEYLNRIYDETPSNDGLDLDLLPVFASDLG